MVRHLEIQVALVLNLQQKTSEINDADSESKSIIGNVEISYSLFGGLASVYTYQKLKKQSDLKSTELLMKIEQILLNTAKQYYDIAYLQEENKILYELLKSLKKGTLELRFRTSLEMHQN